jgi:hypothetical protein
VCGLLHTAAKINKIAHWPTVVRIPAAYAEQEHHARRLDHVPPLLRRRHRIHQWPDQHRGKLARARTGRRKADGLPRQEHSDERNERDEEQPAVCRGIK